MSSESFLKQVLTGFANALAPLKAALASPQAFASFLGEFGWTLGSNDLNTVTGSLGGLSTLAANPSAMSLEQLAADLVSAANVIRRIANSGAPAAFASSFPRELLDFLVYFALAQQSAPAFALLHFGGVLSERRVPADSTTGRAEYVQRLVDWSLIGQLADQPLSAFEKSYGWGTNFAADAFLRSLGILIRGFGGNAGLYPADSSLVNQYYSHDSSSAAGTTNLIVSPASLQASVASASASANTKLALLAIAIPPTATANAAPDGLAIMPVITGQASDTISLTDTVSIKLAGDVLLRPVRAEFHPGKAVLRASAGDAQVNATARLDAKAAANTPWIPFGTSDSSHLELSASHVALGLTGTIDGDMELTAEIGLDTAALVIDFSEGDSLMQDTVSKSPTKSPLAITIKWSSKTGFALGGQPKLAINIPVQQSLAGVATLQQIGFALGAASNNRLEFDAMLTGTTSIGPVTLTVKEVGLAIYITPSADSDPPGVFGNIDFGFGFKSPSGVGLAIDVAGLTGGGFLSCDPAAGQYTGMLQLGYQQFQLQAFGLIATKLPTGPGYSLIAMIDANFPPIELVAGFTLNGVGGLLGINRTISIDALEAGIKAKTLSNFLFAKNPVANAAQLLTDLDTFFPAAQRRYVFGPLLQIGWGTPTVITIDLALILELPDPVRLVLIGELAVLLPNPDAVLVELHMDVLGTIDFGADEGSLDAVLHDSRIVSYPLQGAMAFRSCWAGDDKTFLLSIGGFHPKFQPPPGFPTLQRLAISMPSGHISKLNLNGYLALSSNTLQIGAHLDIFVGVDGFGISGYLNFDTLIERNPFHFDADISGGVTLSAGGDDVMSLDLSADLSGPAPWHCAGSVHFSVLGFGVTKSFSATFGVQAPALPTDLVDVGAAIRTALSDPRNFSATLTTNENGLVTLRTPTVSGVVLGHPGATLKIDQKVCPLGLTIQKFGAGAPTGGSLFTITGVTADGTAQATTPVTDEFAPAQFLTLSDDDELAAPSFEVFDSGVELGDGALANGPILSRPIGYETLIVDTPGGTPVPADVYKPPIGWRPGIRTVLKDSGRLRYAMPSQPMIRAATLDYVIATTDQIAASGVGATTGQTFAQARAALAAAIAQNPDQRGTLQIVPHYEVAA
jgi:hypothetical protein